MAEKKESEMSEALGISGFTLGVMGIIFLGFNGLITSLTGLIFCLIQQKKHKTKFGKTGVILGIIGIILNIAGIILYIIITPLLNKTA